MGWQSLKTNDTLSAVWNHACNLKSEKHPWSSVTFSNQGSLKKLLFKLP